MKLASVSDYRAQAKRRLPKFAFDFMDGAAGREFGQQRNVESFDDYYLRPNYLVNVEKRSLATKLFGREWSAPVGIAPIGLASLMWPGAEEAMALAAKAANVPYTLASSAGMSLEHIRKVGGEHAWFMLYPGRSEDIVSDMIERADVAGYEVLVVSVDIPLSAIRPRDIRNGFVTPFHITPRIAWQSATHPHWAFATLAAGKPRPVNMDKYDVTNPDGTPAYSRSQATGRFDWDALKKVRDRWRGKVVVKGLLSAADAVKARDIGCDGVSVSNHGGRQSDSLPAPMEVIAEIRAAVGKDFTLILDSGVRSGEHVIKALALGADFVLTGRAMMYAVCAMGHPGAKAGLKLLIDDAAHTMGQIGYTNIASLKAAAPIVKR